MTIENTTIGLVLGIISMMMLIGFWRRISEAIVKAFGIHKLVQKITHKGHEKQ